ncbi:MAG TPA: potassium channel family protein, partial [Chryseolinea sp.]
LMSLITSQITTGIILESKFIVRIVFFLFTVIAIESSSIKRMGKSIGYGVGLSLLILAIIMIWSETRQLIFLYTGVATGYMIYIIVLVINQIFTGNIITLNKIGGGVATYILIGLLWATVYVAIYIIEPDAFRYGGEVIANDTALKHLTYFSFVTLTTIGYGDITPVSSVARVLVMLEGLMGQLFPAIFIARLVSLQIEGSKSRA